LKRAAQRKGMSGEIPAVELIFVDGFSSREEATELSGRGVGLAALRQACLSAGGSIDVDFTPDAGTCLTLKFPRPIVKVGALAAKLERRWSLIPRGSDTRQMASAAAHS
jgi:chemotaxis protein histidine kinase CheA